MPLRERVGLMIWGGVERDYRFLRGDFWDDRIEITGVYFWISRNRGPLVSKGVLTFSRLALLFIAGQASMRFCKKVIRYFAPVFLCKYSRVTDILGRFYDRYLFLFFVF